MIMGGLTALAALIVLIVMGGASKLLALSGVSDQDAATAVPIVAVVGICVAVFLLVLAAPVIIGGWGLLNFRPWSRMLMIVLSVLHLIHIPLGTALGVYGLWVLFSDEGRRLLESGGQVYQPIPGSYPVPGPLPHATYPTRPPPAV